jgi:simple sugar transport system permease protein
VIFKRENLQNWKVTGLCIVAIALLFLLILVAGASPVDAAAKLWDSAFGSPLKFSNTLKETTPLLLAGLAVYIALKAGLFNIGVEGQITIGALCTAIVAIPISGIPGIILGSIAGVIGGALWALPAGWLKAYRGGHEVISTIMLNNIASGLTLALVAGPLKDPGQEGTTTRDLAANTMLPNIIDTKMWQLNIALPIGIALLFLFSTWLKKSVSGYELRMVGANHQASEFAGIEVKRTIMKAMLASGAIAGFTGSILVLAFEHRFFQGMSSGFGFDALGVAMLAGTHPLAMLGSGLLFGILNKGSSAIQILGIPKGITWIVLALLIIIFAAVRYRKEGSHE